MKRSAVEVNGIGAGAPVCVPVTPLLLSEQSARWFCGQSVCLLAPGAGGRGFGDDLMEMIISSNVFYTYTDGDVFEKVDALLISVADETVIEW